MQINTFNACFSYVQAFGMRTAKLHLNWEAVDKPWSPNNVKRASVIGSGLVSGDRSSIEGYVEC